MGLGRGMLSAILSDILKLHFGFILTIDVMTVYKTVYNVKGILRHTNRGLSPNSAVPLISRSI